MSDDELPGRLLAAGTAELLRKPFPPELIGKLPRVTCRDCSGSRQRVCDRHTKSKCDECGAWITTAHIHLDYVGHAEVTDRLLSVDPQWTWEPLALTLDGLPTFDHHGGLWIKLTVGGVTRLGYGHAGDKHGGDAIKEVIGDALRNAAMRFGVALDLWSKSDLAAPAHTQVEPEPEKAEPQIVTDPEWLQAAFDGISEATTGDDLDRIGVEIKARFDQQKLNKADYDRLREAGANRRKSL